ncbi:MAG: hypothetical protein MH472_06935 [Bacteroidia bacterium]|nr:hypothetical protein [Bacteroidia bacterium]
MKQGFLKGFGPAQIIIPLLNIIAMIYIQPFVVPYYGMVFPYNFLYLIIVFSAPLWIYIPAAILIFPFAWIFTKIQGSHKRVFIPWLGKAFLAVNLVFLMLNLLLVSTKFFMNHEPFPKIVYAQIRDKANGCDSLRRGHFKSRNRYIFRKDSVQTEISLNLKDTFLYRVTWLNDCEYRLINMGESGAMNDTLDVKITNQTPDYYEGFLRSGNYAIYTRVLKKWE